MTITEGTSWIRLISSECSLLSCQEQESLWFCFRKVQWRCARSTGLSEDRKWNTEFMSRVKGAPCDFKATAGDDINDGGIAERVDARP